MSGKDSSVQEKTSTLNEIKNPGDGQERQEGNSIDKAVERVAEAVREAQTGCEMAPLDGGKDNITDKAIESISGAVRDTQERFESEYQQQEKDQDQQQTHHKENELER